LDESAKSFIQGAEQVYPVARIRWHKTKGSFALIGARSDKLENLSDFFQICLRFPPRRLRNHERLSKTLNVLLSATPDFSNASRTLTTNISLSGCFLHTPHEWHVGASIYIQIKEMPEKITLHGTVVRYVPWGVHFNAQGIGVQFIDVDEKQIKALQYLLCHIPNKYSAPS
jgi:Tfp pilus assembly protein PilZ